MTEGGDEKPDFLYHYTSIEGLANILSSKQIRFSRLDLLDDLTEGESLDPVDWRQFYFVSCWTSSEQESIPLWHMYTGNMKGVRLKLPAEMFRLYELDLETVPRAVQLFAPDLVRNNLSGKFLSYLPYALIELILLWHPEIYQEVQDNYFEPEEALLYAWLHRVETIARLFNLLNFKSSTRSNAKTRKLQEHDLVSISQLAREVFKPTCESFKS